MLNLSLNGKRPFSGEGYPRFVAGWQFLGATRRSAMEGALYLHSNWACHALHSHFFGQPSRNRFGRRGRTKG